MIKTLLVDDHNLLVSGLKNIFSLGDSNFSVVGTASTSAEALMKVEMLQPELVLMDIQLADCDGIETTKVIKKEFPATKIVMLTAFADEKNLFAAIEAGADGYLLKNMDPEALLWQLDGLANGQIPLAPGLADHLRREFSRRGRHGIKDPADLNERQQQVLWLLSQGLTYKEIGAQLELKEVTIRYHIRYLLAKLKLENRAQLIAYALRGFPRDDG
ncbi:MAG: vraR 2 [Firmicutes bacterium]|nr:vraR 2 [Bacillota bacterium]